MSRATAAVLTTQLNGASNVQPFEARSTNDAAAARATAALEGYFELHNGELRLKGVIRDLATNRTLRIIDSQGRADRGVLPVLNTVAREITTSPRAYGTSSETALKEYFTAISAQSRDQIAPHLEAAIQADPRFALPYLAEIESLSAKGDVAGAKEAIARANSASQNFAPFDRARLHLFESAVNNDLAARTKATAELAALQPKDAEIRKTLAELYLAQKNYKGAVQALEEASRIAPADIGVWNALGYAYAYAGDLNSAMRAFGQYKQLAPEDANAIDSTAEALFYSGNFAEAEKAFLAAHAKNAARFQGIELYRAALCRLLMGDNAKANEHFNSYADFRKQDPSLPLQRAVWMFEIGRAKEAVAALEQLAASTPQKELASIAGTQLALWRLEAGDRERARADAQAALQGAASIQARNLAMSAAYCSMPSASAAEWRARADKVVSGAAQSRFKDQLLATALLLDRKYTDAIPVWRTLYETASPAGSLEAPVLLAWCYWQAGQKDEAAKLIRAGIIPPHSPDPGLGPIAVRKYVELRQMIAK